MIVDPAAAYELVTFADPTADSLRTEADPQLAIATAANAKATPLPSQVIGFSVVIPDKRSPFHVTERTESPRLSSLIVRGGEKPAPHDSLRHAGRHGATAFRGRRQFGNGCSQPFTRPG